MTFSRTGKGVRERRKKGEKKRQKPLPVLGDFIVKYVRIERGRRKKRNRKERHPGVPVSKLSARPPEKRGKREGGKGEKATAFLYLLRAEEIST